MQTFNLIRAVVVILAILIFTVLCLTDESRHYPNHEPPELHELEIPETDPIIEFSQTKATE